MPASHEPSSTTRPDATARPAPGCPPQRSAATPRWSAGVTLALVTVTSKDLDLAHALADAADRVSMAQFRSEELRTTTKVDGTPVSQIDFDVEQAMLDVIRDQRPTDAFLGEEVGPHAGTSGRRWIVDGIDGTHNYADGRAGWGTIIACEVEGEIAVGMVSSPLLRPALVGAAGRGRVVGTVRVGRQVRRGRGRPAAVRLGGCARRGVGDRHPLRKCDARLAQRGVAAVHPPGHSAEPMLRDRCRDGGIRRARRGDPHLRRPVGLRCHEPHRQRGRRRVPRRLGRHALRHRHGCVHEQRAHRSGARGIGRATTACA